MDFTAFDFETANAQRTSACSIGIAVVENNRVVERRHLLIRPEPFYFSSLNIGIHGICAADVVDEPTFGQLWRQIEPFFDGRTIAAHYAPFDIGVLRGTLAHYGISVPRSQILCSCKIAKAAYPRLESHKLDNVCGALGIPLDHHNAESDAAGCAQIIISAMEENGIDSMDGLKHKLSVSCGRLEDGVYEPCRRRAARPYQW